MYLFSDRYCNKILFRGLRFPLYQQTVTSSPLQKLPGLMSSSVRWTTLWWEVVNSNGNTGWQAISLTRNLCPDALALWLMFRRVANFDRSAKVTLQRFRVPLWCLEIILTTGAGLYLWAPARMKTIFNNCANFYHRKIGVGHLNCHPIMVSSRYHQCHG